MTDIARLAFPFGEGGPFCKQNGGWGSKLSFGVNLIRHSIETVDFLLESIGRDLASPAEKLSPKVTDEEK